jgi:hypothetical protein
MVICHLEAFLHIPGSRLRLLQIVVSLSHHLDH